MGGPWFSWSFFAPKISDLTEEDVEEIRMLSGFSEKEVHRLRLEFLKHCVNSSRISREEFLAIPVISINPLRERLLPCFNLDVKPSISFLEFITALSGFNGLGRDEQKLKLAFRLHDFDEDGRLSKSDLVEYLTRVSATSDPKTALDCEAVAEEILREASTEEDHRYLTYENFQRVVGTTDFTDKLRIPI